MSETPVRKFPVFVQLYTWGTLLGLSLAPLALAWRANERTGPLPREALILVVGVIVLMQLLFWYVQRRCSSLQLPYWDGLLYIAWSMETGWTYFSIPFVALALTVTLTASLVLALLGELSRDRRWAATRYLKLVQFFYKHRLIQE